MDKKFANTKKNTIFAKVLAKEQCILMSKVFFYASNSAKAENIIGYQTPLTDCLAQQSSCSLARTEGDSLSCFKLFSNNFIRKMPKNNEIESNVNNSSVRSTPNGAKTVCPPYQIITQWDDPRDFQKSLDILFQTFVCDKIAEETEFRITVFMHYKLLMEFLQQLIINPTTTH